MSPPAAAESLSWDGTTELLTGRGSPKTPPVGHAHDAATVTHVAFVLEACGPLRGRHVLDYGFGDGQLARILDVLGGSVNALDVVGGNIPRLREEAPSVYWSVADIANWQLAPQGTPYDLIVACDVLQHLDFDAVVANLIAALTDRGRLVIVIPCSDRGSVQASASQRAEAPLGAAATRGISRLSLHGRFACYREIATACYRGIRPADAGEFAHTSDPWQWLDLATPQPRKALQDDEPPEWLQITVFRKPAAVGHGPRERRRSPGQ